MAALLQSQIKQLRERMDAMALRERALLFLSAMAVIYVLAMNVLLGPLFAEQNRLEKSLKAKQQEINTIHTQLQALVGGTQKDVDAERRQKVVALEQELKTVNQQVSNVSAGVVSPQEMAKLLQQLLARNQGLQLIKIESIAAVPALENGAASNSGPMIYKHGTRIELRGRYFEIVDYLKALEALPWKVFWGEIVLEAETYPISRVSLVVYTVSPNAAWIGV